MKLLTVYLVAGAATYLLRASMVLSSGRISAAQEWLTPRLKLASPAVIAAMVAAAVLNSSAPSTSVRLTELAAIAAAFAAVRRTGNVTAALVVGFPAYWVATGLL